MSNEAVEESFLIRPFLNPTCRKIKFRLAFRLHVKTIILSELFHGIT